MFVIDTEGVAALISLLLAEGRQVLGPTAKEGAIVLDALRALEDLPIGLTDRHAPGSYRLEPRQDRALFGYVVGPQSFKPAFFPPRLTLLRVKRSDGRFHVLEAKAPIPKLAIFGARGCDLAAIAVQDRVLGDGPHRDPDYVARRQDLFVVAVNCTESRSTCFCTSMGTGPRAERGFDLALTEILDGEHRFLVEVGSAAGASRMASLAHRDATDSDRAAAERGVVRAAEQMGRRLDTHDIKALLTGASEHPRFDDVAQRCLSCANCTLVCPTCFCSTIEDTSDVTGETAERSRRWDSCFTLEHSHMHGGAIHASTRSRYRQWMTHKLATWIDQFGSSGCVGCGRCVTWCPAGIDLTEEVAAIRAAPGGAGGTS